MAKKRVILKKEKRVSVAPIDSVAKLNKSAQNIITIAHEELNVLLNNILNGGVLSNEELRKFETLTRIINSQQKHAIDLEKLRLDIEKAKDATTVNNNLIVTEEQLKQLKENYRK